MGMHLLNFTQLLRWSWLDADGSRGRIGAPEPLLPPFDHRSKFISRGRALDQHRVCHRRLQHRHGDGLAITGLGLNKFGGTLLRAKNCFASR